MSDADVFSDQWDPGEDWSGSRRSSQSDAFAGAGEQARCNRV